MANGAKQSTGRAILTVDGISVVVLGFDHRERLHWNDTPMAPSGP